MTTDKTKAALDALTKLREAASGYTKLLQTGESWRLDKVIRQALPVQPAPGCSLCQKGFPKEDGFHYGTQSKGMIESTACPAQGKAPAETPKPLNSASRRIGMPPEMAAPYTECGKRPDRETERNRVEALMRSRRHQRAIQHFRLRYSEAEEGQFEYVKLDPYEAEMLLKILEGEA